jgi:hypothetical protein
MDIGPAESTRPVAVEEQLRRTAVVLELARRGLHERRIDPGAGIPRPLPVEGVVNVIAVRDPDVHASRTAAPVAGEEQPILVAGQGGDRLDTRRVDAHADVLRLEPGPPRALFTLTTTSSYEPSPDGQRFLVTAVVSEASPITVILNWKPPGR